MRYLLTWILFASIPMAYLQQGPAARSLDQTALYHHHQLPHGPRPSPPPTLERVRRAFRSRCEPSPCGSASAGFGSSSNSQWSRQCWCDGDRSVSVEACHLAMNSYGVMGAFRVAHDDRHLPRQADPPARAVVTGGIVGPATSACAHRHQGRLAVLRPRSAALTALTLAPRTLVQIGP